MYKHIRFWLAVYLIYLIAGGFFCSAFLFVVWLIRSFCEKYGQSGDFSSIGIGQSDENQMNFKSSSNESHSVFTDERIFSASHNLYDEDSRVTVVNPATGLPMVSNSCAGIDVGGNSYGTNDADFNSSYDIGHDSFGSMDTFDTSYDLFSSSHDSFGSSSSNGFD